MLGCLFIICILGNGWAPAASAHANASIAYSELSVIPGAIRYDLLIDMYDIRLAADPNDPAISDNSPETLQRFIQNAASRIEAYILSHSQVYADNLPLHGSVKSLKAVHLENDPQPYLKAVLEYPYKLKPQSLALHYDLIYESDQWHVNYVKLHLGESQQTGVIVYELREIHTGTLSANVAAEVLFRQGLDRTIHYWEPALIVLALLLTAKIAENLKQRLLAVAVFVIALWTTSSISGMNLASLPVTLIDLLVSLSVLYFALYLAFTKHPRRLFWYAGSFGAIQGLGVSLILSGLRDGSKYREISAVAFSTGYVAGLLLACIGLVTATLLVHKHPKLVPFLLGSLSFLELMVFFWKLANV